ncbi:hypothetical protein [Bradyrhizobium retamae]|nr:hypothetical protein [Bradyrhizobium retamae]
MAAKSSAATMPDSSEATRNNELDLFQHRLERERFDEEAHGETDAPP